VWPPRGEPLSGVRPDELIDRHQAIAQIEVPVFRETPSRIDATSGPEGANALQQQEAQQP